jgi:hypothetical protein
MPWLLNREQTAALQALQRERDLALLGEQLAHAFPDANARLGERYTAFIALAAQRGATHGLQHLAELGRYIGCWATLGAEFETKPGFEWAAALLAAAGQPDGARIFQLCRRVREWLVAQPAPGRLAPEAFEAAITLLDEALRDAGDLGHLDNLAEPAVGGARRRLRLGRPCDLDVLDLRPAEAVARQQYALSDKHWQREPVAPPIDALTLRPPGLKPAPRPSRIALLSVPAGGAGVARVRLRTRAAHLCELHPWARLTDSAGVRDWRGALAGDVTWAAPAARPAAPAAGSPQPTMAEETSANLQTLDVYSCGLRESGAPTGDLHLVVAAYPGEQRLLTWQRPRWPVLGWPETAAPVPTPATQMRLEQDGVALDAGGWLAGFRALDEQLKQGLALLASAWERTSGVSASRLEAEPRLLCGSAGITWGWAERPQGLLAAPYLRVAGAIDITACRLDLRFTGVLALGGSLSRLTLHCAAAETLQSQWERLPDDADLMAMLGHTKVAFRQPFVLVMESVARDELAVLNAASPVTGALVGSCGLRPRGEGPGLEWFVTLAIEPVNVVMLLHDPLLGQQEVLHPLLPATTLVDWSLG